MFKNSTKFILVSLILLTSVLRLVKLGSIPPGFANDEGAITYQAYSILKTGHDTWNNQLPLLSFKDFGEHLPPFAVYAQVPFIYLLGLNEFASRLPFALTSIISIFPIYILTQNLFKRKEISQLACLLFAISPLNIGWSRFVYEGNFGALFFLLGFTFYVLSKKKINYLILSLLFFGLTFTTYHIYYLITPLTILALFTPRLNFLTKNKMSLLTILLLLSILIGIYYILIVSSGSGRERFRQVSIFNKQSLLDNLNTKRNYCRQNVPDYICKIFLNKGTTFLSEYSYNYFFHFSPTYLALDGTFLRGEILPVHGLIYPFELPFFYIGTIYLLFKRNVASYLVFVWLVLYPAANSFTGVGEISRITQVMPLLPIITSLGIFLSWRYLQKKRHKKIIYALFVVFAFFNVSSFLIDYFLIFPVTNSKNGSYAYVQLFKKLKNDNLHYNNIFITRDYLGSAPEFQARIFLPIDPRAFQDPSRNNYLLKKPENYVDYQRLDNFNFVSDTSKIIASQGDLVVLNKYELKDTYKVIFDIKEPSGETSLYATIR